MSELSPLLKIQNLSFSYGNLSVIKEINLDIYPNEVTALIGSSGSGKSTFFKLIAGILQPSRGSISVHNGLPSAHTTAYMMQEDLLLPWRTVLENIMLPLELGNNSSSRQEIIPQAHALIHELALTGYSHFYPDEISGGMRQRVSLARALIQKRPLLLLDEPFGSLDVTLREHMYSLLRTLRLKYHTAQLLVTHDFRDAISLADRILLLSQGSICKEWTISPQSRFDFNALGSLQEEMKEALRKEMHEDPFYVSKL